MTCAGGIISRLSQQQATFATSTTEAEIITATEAAKEVIWLQRLSESLNVTLKHVPVLQVNNSTTVKLAQNPKFHRHAKHTDHNNLFIDRKFATRL